jgi:small subunit ribosomal protein S2
MATITMKALLEAGVHFGHQTRRWNPKMSKYIFGTRNKIHIIDLQKTLKELKKNYKVIRDYIAEGRNIIFVGTKKQAQIPLKEEALRCGAFFVCDRWLGGTLTNFETLKKSINRYKEIEKMKEEQTFELLSKKEQSRIEKELTRLVKSLEGLKNMSKLPGLMFVIDPYEEATAIAEARKLGIPIVAICDTNCDPDLVDYPVPGNDDAIRAVKLFCSIVADAVLEGKSIIEKTEESTGENVEQNVQPSPENAEPLGESEAQDTEASEAVAETEAAVEVNPQEVQDEPEATVEEKIEAEQDSDEDYIQ